MEPLGSDAGGRGSASCLSSNEEDLVSSGGAPLGSGQPGGHIGEVQAQPLREALGVGQAQPLREALEVTTETQAAVQGCVDTPSQPCDISLLDFDSKRALFDRVAAEPRPEEHRGRKLHPTDFKYGDGGL